MTALEKGLLTHKLYLYVSLRNSWGSIDIDDALNQAGLVESDLGNPLVLPGRNNRSWKGTGWSMMEENGFFTLKVEK